MKATLLIITLFSFLFLAPGADEIEEILAKGQALQRENKIEQAQTLLKEGIQKHPRSSDLHAMLGLVTGQRAGTTKKMMEAMSFITEAFKSLDKALELDPQNWKAHYYWGLLASHVPSFLGKQKPGVEHLRKGIALMEKSGDPEAKSEITELYRYLGRNLQILKEAEKAKGAWEKILAINPGCSAAKEARKNLGIPEEPKKEPPPPAAKEEKKVEKGKMENPNAALIKEILSTGEACLKKGDFPRARNLFQKAVALAPDSGRAVFLLARSLMEDAGKGYDERIYEDQDWRSNLAMESVRLLDKALELAPKDKEIRLYHAVVGSQMPSFVGNLDESIRELEILLKEDTLSKEDKASVSFYLGHAYRRKGTAYWTKLVSEHGDSQAAQMVLQAFGPASDGPGGIPKKAGGVSICFYLAYQDDIPPQTALWIEDEKGKFVRTLYVSGFSAFVKEQQVVLPDWAEASGFQVDGVSGASIDLGAHTFHWDLTGPKGVKMKDGNYKVVLETHYWPSMQYDKVVLPITVSRAGSTGALAKGKLIAFLKAEVR